MTLEMPFKRFGNYCIILYCQCGHNNRMVYIHVGDGRNVNARWLAYVDDVDAPMSGQSWFDVTASFLAMWDVMMLAMMIQCLVPMLFKHISQYYRSG